MRQEMMTIIKQEEIAPRIFEMTLKGDLVQEMGESGQFIHIRVPRQDLLLRRPISLNRIHRELGTCRIIYRVEGDGTQIFSEMTAGDVLDVMGPLGRGFDLSQLQAGDQAFIIGGGIGIPPLYELSAQLRQKGVHCHHFLGYATKDAVFYEEAFSQLGSTHVSTDDGSYGFHGNVCQMVRQAGIEPDAVFSCGSNGLLKAVYQACQGVKNIQLSLEERMACGMGACAACVCRSSEDGPQGQIRTKKVCEDGPVFQAKEVVL